VRWQVQQIPLSKASLFDHLVGAGEALIVVILESKEDIVLTKANEIQS
jgi:hypothetical protein